MKLRNILFMAVFALANPAWAADDAKEAQNEVVVRDARITETAPDQTKAALQVELTCVNAMGKLVEAESPLAESVVMQRLRVSHGRLVTEAVTAVPMRHNRPMRFAPETVSLVLQGLKKPLLAGTIVPVNLTVVTNGKKVIVEVKARVKPREAEKPADVGGQAQSAIAPVTAPAE